MSHPIPRWSNATALVLAPAAGLVAAVAVPGLSSTTKGGLELVAAHPERYHLYAVGMLVSSYLLIPAYFGLMALVGRRNPTWAYLAGGLAQVGVVIAVGDAATESMYWKMGSASDLSPMVTVFDRYDAGTNWIYAIGGLTVLVGSVALGAGLWRTRVLPRWAAVGTPLGLVLNIVGFSAASQPALMLSYVVMLAAFSRAAQTLVARTEPAPAAQPSTRPSARPVQV
jgi:hypothetical protein